MVRRVLLLIVLTFAVPASAQAATVTLSGGVLKYAAEPGKVSNLVVTQSGASVTITRATGDDDPLTGGAGCTAVSDTAVTCPSVTRVEIDAGDRADRVFAGGLGGLITIPAFLTGGPGSDVLTGGAANDVLRGDEGNDVLEPNTGTDSISGGDGIDTASFGLRAAPTYSLDALANDGDAGENDLIGSDVENVQGSARDGGLVTIIGDGRSNQLSIVEGRGDITGGDGADVMEGGPLDDIFRARDGAPDTIICNGGVDTVEADTQDIVSTTCENVSIAAAPGGAFDDRPPTLGWTAPGAGASLAANTPTTLRVEANDDRGLAKVQFLDDDRLVCEDTVAPFDCEFQPRGGDVGRNTLIAIAVDTAGQTTSIVRPVTVRRFTPAGLTLKLAPSRDRRAPYSFKASGTLVRPPTVAPSQGCSGRVVITAKRGSKTVSTTRTSLSRSCEYEKTIRFRTKVGSRIRLTAKFEGNDVLAARTAPRRTARLG